MNVTAEEVDALVERELAKITDPRVIALVRSLRVPTRCEDRHWDYGLPDEAYPCWIVLEHPRLNTAIAFCADGFGPFTPWGLLFLAGPHLSMGMDSEWFSTLEEAVRNSWAWEE